MRPRRRRKPRIPRQSSTRAGKSTRRAWDVISSTSTRLRSSHRVVVRKRGVDMRFAIALGLALAGAATIAPAFPLLAASDACESLAALTLPHSIITMAQPVAAGAFTPPAAGGGAADGGA